jgi:F0F1-type ATP synthase membrane subunit b/b'
MIEPRLEMRRGNKAEVLRKHKRILRDAQQFLKDARQVDEDIVNGVKTGRKPISRESLAEKQVRRQMKQQKFQQEVEAVKVHP